MFIYSMFIEALVLKVPDVKALYAWKIHLKTLLFIKQRTFSFNETEISEV